MSSPRAHPRSPTLSRRDPPQHAPIASLAQLLLMDLADSPYTCYSAISTCWAVPAGARPTFDIVIGHPPPLLTAPVGVEVRIPAPSLALPPALARAVAVSDNTACTAVSDFYTRVFADALAETSSLPPNAALTGGSIEFAQPGVQVVGRSAAVVAADGSLALRMGVVLPTVEGKVAGQYAAELFAEVLPATVAAVFDAPQQELVEHHRALARQRSMRAQLAEKGLCAFIPVDNDVITCSGTLTSTLSFEGEEIQGVGIPANAGLFVIAGDSGSGKTALIHALRSGPYDLLGGGVVTVPATKLSRERRYTSAADIRAIIPRADYFAGCFVDGVDACAVGLIDAAESETGLILVDEDDISASFLSTSPALRSLTPTGSVHPLTETVLSLPPATVIVAASHVDGLLEHADFVCVLRNRELTLVRERTTPVLPLRPPLRPPQRVVRGALTASDALGRSAARCTSTGGVLAAGCEVFELFSLEDSVLVTLAEVVSGLRRGQRGRSVREVAQNIAETISRAPETVMVGENELDAGFDFYSSRPKDGRLVALTKEQIAEFIYACPAITLN